jgi:hypothetical protein
MRYSQTTGCFYPDDINYSSMPPDLVTVKDEEYAAAMTRPTGYTIEVIGGTLSVAAPAPASASEQALAQIADLERTVTPRRMREAALGIDNGWLKAVDDQIALLRASLA